jgi:hypothetical protein
MPFAICPKSSRFHSFYVNYVWSFSDIGRSY